MDYLLGTLFATKKYEPLDTTHATIPLFARLDGPDVHSHSDVIVPPLCRSESVAVGATPLSSSVEAAREVSTPPTVPDDALSLRHPHPLVLPGRVAESAPRPQSETRNESPDTVFGRRDTVPPSLSENAKSGSTEASPSPQPIRTSGEREPTTAASVPTSTAPVTAPSVPTTSVPILTRDGAGPRLPLLRTSAAAVPLEYSVPTRELAGKYVLVLLSPPRAATWPAVLAGAQTTSAQTQASPEGAGLMPANPGNAASTGSLTGTPTNPLSSGASGGRAPLSMRDGTPRSSRGNSPTARRSGEGSTTGAAGRGGGGQSSWEGSPLPSSLTAMPSSGNLVSSSARAKPARSPADTQPPPPFVTPPTASETCTTRKKLLAFYCLLLQQLKLEKEAEDAGGAPPPDPVGAVAATPVRFGGRRGVQAPVAVLEVRYPITVINVSVPAQTSGGGNATLGGTAAGGNNAAGSTATATAGGGGGVNASGTGRFGGSTGGGGGGTSSSHLFGNSSPVMSPHVRSLGVSMSYGGTSSGSLSVNRAASPYPPSSTRVPPEETPLGLSTSAGAAGTTGGGGLSASNVLLPGGDDAGETLTGSHSGSGCSASAMVAVPPAHLTLTELLDARLDDSAMETLLFDHELIHNPYYGGWLSVESRDAFRRLMMQCEVHTWPSVLLLDPFGNVLTTTAIDRIEEELTTYVQIASTHHTHLQHHLRRLVNSQGDSVPIVPVPSATTASIMAAYTRSAAAAAARVSEASHTAAAAATDAERGEGGRDSSLVEGRSHTTESALISPPPLDPCEETAVMPAAAADATEVSAGGGEISTRSALVEGSPSTSRDPDAATAEPTPVKGVVPAGVGATPRSLPSSDGSPLTLRNTTNAAHLTSYHSHSPMSVPLAASGRATTLATASLVHPLPGHQSYINSTASGTATETTSSNPTTPQGYDSGAYGRDDDDDDRSSTSAVESEGAGADGGVSASARAVSGTTHPPSSFSRRRSGMGTRRTDWASQPRTGPASPSPPLSAGPHVSSSPFFSHFPWNILLFNATPANVTERGGGMRRSLATAPPLRAPTPGGFSEFTASKVDSNSCPTSTEVSPQHGAIKDEGDVVGGAGGDSMGANHPHMGQTKYEEEEEGGGSMLPPSRIMTARPPADGVPRTTQVQVRNAAPSHHRDPTKAALDGNDDDGGGRDSEGGDDEGEGAEGESAVEGEEEQDEEEPCPAMTELRTMSSAYSITSPLSVLRVNRTRTEPLRRVAHFSLRVGDVQERLRPFLDDGDDSVTALMRSTGQAPFSDPFGSDSPPLRFGAPDKLTTGVTPTSGDQGGCEQTAAWQEAAHEKFGDTTTHLLLLFGAGWHPSNREAIQAVVKLYHRLNSGTDADGNADDGDDDDTGRGGRGSMLYPDTMTWAGGGGGGAGFDNLDMDDSFPPLNNAGGLGQFPRGGLNMGGGGGGGGFNDSGAFGETSAKESEGGEEEEKNHSGKLGKKARSTSTSGVTPRPHIQVIYLSSDDTIASLAASLQDMPPSWLCVSALVPQNEETHGMILSILRTSLSVTTFPRIVVVELPAKSPTPKEQNNSDSEGDAAGVSRDRPATAAPEADAADGSGAAHGAPRGSVLEASKKKTKEEEEEGGGEGKDSERSVRKRYEGRWAVVQAHAERKLIEDPTGRGFPWAETTSRDEMEVTASGVTGTQRKNLPGLYGTAQSPSSRVPRKSMGTIASRTDSLRGGRESSEDPTLALTLYGDEVRFPPLNPFVVEDGELPHLLDRGGFFVVLCATGAVDAKLHRACADVLDEVRGDLYDEIESRKRRAWGEPYLIHRLNPYSSVTSMTPTTNPLTATAPLVGAPGKLVASSSTGAFDHASISALFRAAVRPNLAATSTTATSAAGSATTREEATQPYPPLSLTPGSVANPLPGSLMLSQRQNSTLVMEAAPPKWEALLPSVYFYDAVYTVPATSGSLEGSVVNGSSGSLSNSARQGPSSSRVAAAGGGGGVNKSSTVFTTNVVAAPLDHTEELREAHEFDLSFLQEFIIAPIVEQDEKQLPVREGQLFLACVRLPHRTSAVLRHVLPTEVPSAPANPPRGGPPQSAASASSGASAGSTATGGMGAGSGTNSSGSGGGGGPGNVASASTSGPVNAAALAAKVARAASTAAAEGRLPSVTSPTSPGPLSSATAGTRPGARPGSAASGGGTPGGAAVAPAASHGPTGFPVIAATNSLSNTLRTEQSMQKDDDVDDLQAEVDLPTPLLSAAIVREFLYEQILGDV